MNTDNVLMMPRRFDYGFNYEFNKAVDAMIKHDASNLITLDCEAMEYIDSVGIGLLVMAHKKAQAAQKIITMINLTPGAREVLVLTNLQKLIQFT